MAHRLNCKLWQYTTFCQAFPIQDFLQWYRPPHLHHQKNITSRHHSQHQFVLRRLYPVVWFCLLVLSHYSYQEKRYLASQTLFFLCTRGRSRWQYNVYLPMAIRSLYHHGSLNYVIFILLIGLSSRLLIHSKLFNKKVHEFFVVVFSSNFMTDTISFTQWKPPHPTIFSNPHPPLKNEAPHLKNNPTPHWNAKHPSMKWFLEKAQ